MFDEHRPDKMKSILILLGASVLAALSLSACATAHHVATGAVDEAGHAVEKTTHAVAHGGHKVAKRF
jgi:hypothetical protein